MRRYYIVTNDAYEHIIFDSPYITEIARFTGKTVNNVKSLMSHHENDYSKWRGEYKILRGEKYEPA